MHKKISPWSCSDLKKSRSWAKLPHPFTNLFTASRWVFVMLTLTLVSMLNSLKMHSNPVYTWGTTMRCNNSALFKTNVVLEWGSKLILKSKGHFFQQCFPSYPSASTFFYFLLCRVPITLNEIVVIILHFSLFISKNTFDSKFTG